MAGSEAVRMPWGKYRGKLLTDIPTSYLLWVVREASYAKPKLKKAIVKLLRQRGQRESFQQAEPEKKTTAPPASPDVIKSWYREMTLRFHPDRTLDDGKAMSAINHAYTRLRELLGMER